MRNLSGRPGSLKYISGYSCATAPDFHRLRRYHPRHPGQRVLKLSSNILLSFIIKLIRKFVKKSRVPERSVRKLFSTARHGALMNFQKIIRSSSYPRRGLEAPGYISRLKTAL